MTKVLDLTKQKFGRLTVIKRVENDKHGKSRWLCKCDCGNEIQVVGIDLKSGHTQSCGCLQKEVLLKRTIKHNMSKSRIHRIWSRMKSRCYNEKVIEYKNYGGRGIIIYDEWKNNFQNFYNWSINNGYSDDLTIDRINNDGNYEPSNCRWIDNEQQQKNKRNNHFLTYKETTTCIADWEKIKGFKKGLIKSRLKLGWTIEQAIETPINGDKNMFIKN